MHPQASQNTSSASSGQATTIHNGQYHHDPRTPYGPVYPQTTNVAGRDNTATHLPQMFSGINMQNSRSKYGSKSAIPEWQAAASRASYNSPFIIVPNSTLFNGLPQVPSFVPGSVPGSVPGQSDQLSQYPYLSTGVYPNLNSVVPGTYSSWPYVVNYEMQDSITNKQNMWSSTDGQKGPQAENNGQLQYYQNPFVPTLDGASLSGYTYPSIFPSLGNLSLPFQMMKTTNGYVIQDLEALTQQDPGIPRAVPAMWTNPSELTLAKCLENREGITNVYIRGFLPETTDDMLQAYAARFGKIERCKAIVDLDTGLCKGYVKSSFVDALNLLTGGTQIRFRSVL